MVSKVGSHFMNPLLAILTLTALFSVSSIRAEEPGADPRKRMIFQPGQTELATPAASPTPAAINTSTPDEAIQAFFLALKAGQVDPAYEALVRGTVIAERNEDVKQLKARTSQAIDSYGPIAGFEKIGSLAAGNSLIRHTCISLNQDLPLRWRFYFYKGPSGWKLVDLRVDDGLVELFEEVAREQKK